MKEEKEKKWGGQSLHYDWCVLNIVPGSYYWSLIVLLNQFRVYRESTVVRDKVLIYSIKGCQILKKVSYLFLMTYVLFSRGKHVIISDNYFDMERVESDFQVNAMHFLETVKAMSINFLELWVKFKFVAFPKIQSPGSNGICVSMILDSVSHISYQNVVTLAHCHVQYMVPSAIPHLKQ